MPKEIHTGDMKVDQPDPIIGEIGERDQDRIEVEKVIDDEWAENMKFNEEPVTIRIEPGVEENAPMYHYVAVNGVGAEVLMPNGRWRQDGQLPVGRRITTKRKYLEVLLRSKRTVIRTSVHETNDGDRVNRIDRPTSSSMAVSILDDNPRGHAWATELQRRRG